MRKLYNFHIFDRSKLDDISMITAKGERLTYLQMLQRDWFPRRDIVLINWHVECKCKDCGDEHERNKQTYIEVTPTGLTGDLEFLKTLPEDRQKEVQEIASRMRENALQHEACKKLLAK